MRINVANMSNKFMAGGICLVTEHPWMALVTRAEAVFIAAQKNQ